MDTAPTTTQESRRIQQSDVPPGTIKSRHLEEGITITNPVINGTVTGTWLPTYPAWISYTPNYSASGSMTFTKNTTRKEIYVTIGKVVYLSLCIGGTTGGSASTDIYVSAPVAFATATQDYYGGACGVFDKDGTSTLNYLGGTWSNLNGTTIKVRRYDGGNWTIGAGRFIFLDLFYEIS